VVTGVAAGATVVAETAIGASVTIAETGATVGAIVVTDTAIGASVVIVSIDIATDIECDIDIDI